MQLIEGRVKSIIICCFYINKSEGSSNFEVNYFVIGGLCVVIVLILVEFF